MGCLLGVLLAGTAMAQARGVSPADDLDFAKLIPPSIPRTAIFQQPGYCQWPGHIAGGCGFDDQWLHHWQRCDH